MKIPVIMGNYDTVIEILKIFGKNIENNHPTIIDLQLDQNEWIKLAGGGFWIFLESIILLFCAANFIFGVRALFLFIQRDSFKIYNITQMIIWVNLVCVLILSMLIFDPWNIRYIITEKFLFVMICLFFPSFLTSVFLLAIYLNEVLIAKGIPFSFSIHFFFNFYLFFSITIKIKVS